MKFRKYSYEIMKWSSLYYPTAWLSSNLRNKYCKGLGFGGRNWCLNKIWSPYYCNAKKTLVQFWIALREEENIFLMRTGEGNERHYKKRDEHSTSLMSWMVSTKSLTLQASVSFSVGWRSLYLPHRKIGMSQWNNHLNMLCKLQKSGRYVWSFDIFILYATFWGWQELFKVYIWGHLGGSFG